MVNSDHQNLEYFTTTKVLNRRQARYAQELVGIDFKTVYRPGSQNGKPDALSRRPEYRPEKAGSEDQPITTILSEKHFLRDNKEEKVVLAAMMLQTKTWINWDKSFMERVRIDGERDAEYMEALETVQGDMETEKTTILHQEDGILFRKMKLWVPNGLRAEILESEHDMKVAGHTGQDKTNDLIWRNFWWPGMNDDMIKYIQSCPECQKKINQRGIRPTASCNH
jgi:hypothetical protein